MTDGFNEDNVFDEVVPTPAPVPQPSAQLPEQQQPEPTMPILPDDVNFDDLIMGNIQQPQEPQPTVEQPIPEVSQEERRYQYWQSQADKTKTENENLRAQLERATELMKSTPVQPQAPVTQEPQFPDPPTKPDMPAGFNHAEAYQDPNSQSATYLRNLETWKADITEYGIQKQEFSYAMNEAKSKAEKEETDKAAQYAKQQEAYRQQLGNLSTHLTTNYGATPEQAQDFINRMSSQESVSIENLWKLYQMNSTQTQQVPVNNFKAPHPSTNFTQTQRAQQIAPSMGVIPTQSPDVGRTAEDLIMQKMMGIESGENPF